MNCAGGGGTGRPLSSSSTRRAVVSAAALQPSGEPLPCLLTYNGRIHPFFPILIDTSGAADKKLSRRICIDLSSGHVSLETHTRP